MPTAVAMMEEHLHARLIDDPPPGLLSEIDAEKNATYFVNAFFR